MNIYLVDIIHPPSLLYKKNCIGLCQTIIVPSLAKPLEHLALLASNTTKRGHKCFKPLAVDDFD